PPAKPFVSRQGSDDRRALVLASRRRVRWPRERARRRRHLARDGKAPRAPERSHAGAGSEPAAGPRHPPPRRLRPRVGATRGAADATQGAGDAATDRGMVYARRNGFETALQAVEAAEKGSACSR